SRLVAKALATSQNRPSRISSRPATISKESIRQASAGGGRGKKTSWLVDREAVAALKHEKLTHRRTLSARKPRRHSGGRTASHDTRCDDSCPSTDTSGFGPEPLPEMALSSDERMELPRSSSQLLRGTGKAVQDEPRQGICQPPDAALHLN